MPISVICPHCDTKLNALDKQAGKKISCPTCGKLVRVGKRAPADEEEEPAERDPKWLYVQERGGNSNKPDTAGIISLVIGIFAAICLVMGWFTGGITYYVAVPLALIGFLASFLGRGNLRIADLAVNFLVLLPAAIILALHLAGLPMTQKGGPQVAVATTPATQEKVVEKGAEEPQPEQVKAKEPVWRDATKGPLALGEVLVQVKEVKVDAVKGGDLAQILDAIEPGASKKKALHIQLQIGNVSKTKKIDHQSWTRSAVKLTDNFQNSYSMAGGGDLLAALSGQQSKTEAIHPQTSIFDQLVFELPLDNVQYLRLALPAENFGGRGTLYFQIPRTMIQR